VLGHQVLQVRDGGVGSPDAQQGVDHSTATIFRPRSFACWKIRSAFWTYQGDHLPLPSVSRLDQEMSMRTELAPASASMSISRSESSIGELDHSEWT